MLLPILEASFRLGLGATITVVMLADFIIFMGAYGLKFGEYIEAGAMSVIYSVMGVLVWLLVNNLRAREAKLCAQSRGTGAHPSAIAIRREARRDRTDCRARSRTRSEIRSR